MNKLSAIALVMFVSFGAVAKEQIEVRNGQLYTRDNGVVTNHGKVRDVKERNGKVEIYTNRGYSKPAMTLDRRGNIDYEEEEDE